jgi:hypothetical protein
LFCASSYIYVVSHVIIRPYIEHCCQALEAVYVFETASSLHNACHTSLHHRKKNVALYFGHT